VIQSNQSAAYIYLTNSPLVSLISLKFIGVPYMFTQRAKVGMNSSGQKNGGFRPRLGGHSEDL